MQRSYHPFRSVLALPAALALATPALADITVGPGGSGSDYEQITDALTAAPVGETIRVAAGSYDAFVVTQGVTIVGAGGGQSIVKIVSGSTEGAIDVTALPAGQRVVLSGLSIQRNSSSLDGRIEITDCAGSVHLIDVESLNPTIFGVTRYSDEAVLRVENSDAVICEHCTLLGWSSSYPQEWKQGSPAVHAIGSRVWLNDCELRGGHGSEGNGGAALLAVDGSFVHGTRSSFEGGWGGAHFGFEWWDIYGFQGEEALTIDASTVVLAGGPGNLARGGAGNQVDDLNWSGGGAAALLSNGGVLRRTPDSVLASGINGDGSQSVGFEVQTHFISTGFDIVEPERRATLASASPVLSVGGPVDLFSSGEPGALHYAFAGALPISPVEIPGLAQHVHLDATQVVPLALIPLDGAGLGGYSTSVPNVPQIAGLEFLVQSIDLDFSTLQISNPALLFVAQ